MNNQELYNLYIQQYLQEQAKRQEGNSLNKLKGYSNKIGNYGNNLSTVGNVIKDNLNSSLAQNFGNSIANVGNAMSEGANAISNTLNTPQNYFKGFANNTLNSALNNTINAGNAAAGGTGATAGVATGASTAATGATTAGTAATTGATASGAATGTAAGSTAAGTTAASSAGGTSAGAAGGPIGALIALAIMGLVGTHRKAAKKANREGMKYTKNITEQENDLSEQNLQQTQQSAANLQQEANNAIAQGVPTGGAASIQTPDGAISDFPTSKEAFAQSLRKVGWDDNTINSALNGLNLGNKEMSDYINMYNQTANQGQAITIPQTEQEIETARALASDVKPVTQQGEVATSEQLKRGILDKLANGLKDFSMGYQENRNNGFSPENLTNNQFVVTTESENPTLANYQQTLRDKGYSDEVINAVAQGKNSGKKEIADWINNNQSAYKPISNTKYYEKSKMGRAGEFFGTLGRVAQNPAAQAIVAGGLSTALSGNPLYGLGMAYKYGNGRAMNNIYQDALAKQGIEVEPGTFGRLSSTDMNALMMPQYKEMDRDIRRQYYNDMRDYHNMMVKYHNDKLEADIKNNEVKNEIANKNASARQTSANASVIRANNSGRKSGTGKRSGKTTKAMKPQDNKDWAADLAGFNTIMSNPKYVNKLDIARSRFISKYGVDPMKYIK